MDWFLYDNGLRHEKVNCAMWYLATTYQKINSSIVSKGALISFKEMFPLDRMFPLAVMRICAL